MRTCGALVIYAVAYLALAFRRAYGTSIVERAWKAAAVVVLYFAVVAASLVALSAPIIFGARDAAASQARKDQHGVQHFR